MKINFTKHSRSAYALVIVLVMSLIAIIILGGTLNRTYGVARMNNRAVDTMNAQNAAEAAIEKVFSRMQYDFQSAGGTAMVSNNLATYRGLVPTTTEDPYWANFSFSDGQGNANKVYVMGLTNFTGPLPIAYSNRPTYNAPIFRILANAKPTKGTSGATGTAQEDVMLALLPLSDYAIFYNGLLEFSTCATMAVDGAVHCNTNIYVGAGSGAGTTLTFNTTVTASGTVTAPANNGQTWTGPTNYNSGNWRTYFNGATNFITKLATVQISIPMTNTHSLIDVPATDDSGTLAGHQRLYNQAQVVVTISNQFATDVFTNHVVVAVRVQKAPSSADVPGADTGATNVVLISPTYTTLTNNFPFLNITNLFYDPREKTTNVTTQIDVGLYKKWLTNATSPVVSKFTPDGLQGYPTILFVNDIRNTSTAGGKKLDVVRLTNGISPPVNGGLGFSVATPNPLYVWGSYNQTNPALLDITNTTSGTVPCAFMSDALTILSSGWSDNASFNNGYINGNENANNDTVNAAILTGIVPSTGTDTSHFSGGVHNLPRLLENWGGNTLTLNTSIINLYNSTKAVGVFVNPGTYYSPPTRQFAYDPNFMDPAKVPPGIPCALVALRYNWTTPPPNTVTYNVTP